MMIGILVRRREQTENEVVQKTDTAARLVFIGFDSSSSRRGPL
jgi:hypothetical protein